MMQLITKKLISIGLMAMALSTVASAAPATAVNRADFNHMTTGYPLTGAHAVAVCETCHVGGVFKGTPKECDGCHAVGRRVTATPKSTAHIATNAACDTCHFNTVTFLGARFNHGTAKPGQCFTCHNGRQSDARAPNHNSGLKASESCDKCHRTYAWVPASWNHTNTTPGSCTNAGCHLAGQNQYYKPAGHAARVGMNTYNCDDCHGFVYWTPARYKHNVGGACSSCHNGAIAQGAPTSHNSFTGWPTECSECHFTNSTWSGALGAKPANHIPYNGGTSCTACHTGGSTSKRGASLHVYLTGYACTTCHLSGNPYTGNGQSTKSSGHEGMGGGDDCSKSGCHKPAGNRGTAYVNWD
jgi:hypothetical protein